MPIGRDFFRLRGCPHFRSAGALVLILIAFVLLGIAVSLTRAPWWDEGMLADPAYQLATHGRMGSAILSEYGHPIVRYFPGYHRYTYWTVPLYLVTLAGWFKLFGFSLLGARMLSLVCGIGLVTGAWLIAGKLGGSTGGALLAAALVATDYSVLLSSITVRMDMFTAACGYGAIAAYLNLREKNLAAAVAAASSLAAAAIFAHPIAIIHSGGLVVTALYFDRRRLQPRHALLAACPYLLGAAAWGVYAAKATDVFMGQLSAHVGYRLGGLTSPLKSILWDWRYRYLFYFYPQESIQKVKILVLIIYVAGIWTALWLAIRRGMRSLLYLVILILVYYVELAILDHECFPHYMVHVISALAILLALVVDALWRKRLLRRPILGLAVVAFVSLQIGGHLLKIRANTYKSDYRPTIAFLKSHASPSKLIIGPAQLMFSLGGDYPFVDDARLGGLSGLRPSIIVLDSFHPGPSAFSRREPDMEVWARRVLTEQFALAAIYGEYRIYLANAAAAPGKTIHEGESH